MSTETDGVLQVGEVPVIVRRDSAVEADHSQAVRSGKESALQELLAFTQAAKDSSPKYTDTRPYDVISAHILDKIREITDGAQEG